MPRRLEQPWIGCAVIAISASRSPVPRRRWVIAISRANTPRPFCMPPSWRDRALLAAMRAVPAPLAKHALFLLRTHPSLADSLGYHVRPIHYYEPLPDFRHIREEATTRRRISAAIDFDPVAQLRLARRLAAERGSELAQPLDSAFDFANGYFGGVDAAIYYALIRDLRPARVIEIGAGMSSRIAAMALARNRGDGSPGELQCIEPFP